MKRRKKPHKDGQPQPKKGYGGYNKPTYDKKRFAYMSDPVYLMPRQPNEIPTSRGFKHEA